MKKNMGTIDRVVRILIAALVGILFATNAISGLLAIILLGLSGVLVVTSIVGFCPLYALVGIKTCPAERA